jgi:hypothetical protein
VINPETKRDVLHLASTLFIERKKNTDAAIIAIAPSQNVNPVPSVGTDIAIKFK